MTQHYHDETSANDPHTLPNIETFFRTGAANLADGWCNEDGESWGEGWYWWSCFPGCLPDSEPFGPFPTEAAALADAREE